MSLSTLLAAVRNDLKDTAVPYRWEDGELTRHIQHASDEISRVRPYEKKTVLSLVDASTEIDISSLTSRIRIERIEYKLDQTPKQFRNWSDEFGDSISITLSTLPSVEESLLTGTVTFASNSAAVSGSGTAFVSEIEVGDYIKKSSDTEWYRVKSIASNTSLTLSKVYAGTTEADGAGKTPVRGYDEVVGIWWDSQHTIAADTCTLPDDLQSLAIEGAGGYALDAYVIGGQKQVVDAIARFADIDVSLAQISARMIQAVNDLASGRAKIGAKLTEAEKALDDMSIQIQQSITNLSKGQDLINAITIGRDPTGDYARYATVELNNARSYLSQSRQYLDEDRLAGEYSGSARREIETAFGYMREAQSHINLINSGLSAARIMSQYMNLSQAKLLQFKLRLQAFKKVKAYKDYPE